MKEIIFAAFGLGLLTAACGASDGPSSGGNAGSSAAGAASSGTAGSAGRGTTQSGGAAGENDSVGSGEAGSESGAEAGSSAGGASATGGASAAGGASSAGCVLDAPIVSCFAETGGGVAVCTETAIDGTSAQVVRDQCGGTVSEGEHCPTNPQLAGYCKGGVTTFYYEPVSGQIWANIGVSCEATSGKWCGK